MRKTVVIDTNVLITAEGGLGTSGPCTERCQKRLLEVQAWGCVALDSHWEIMKEYSTNLNKSSRQPGIGFKFWKWLLNNRSAPGHSLLVTITPHKLKGYEEFPDHKGLEKFDASDRKFVAVAAKCSPKAHILQATDCKWVGWRPPLAECGIEVELVCKGEIEGKFLKKKGHGA